MCLCFSCRKITVQSPLCSVSSAYCFRALAMPKRWCFSPAPYDGKSQKSWRGMVFPAFMFRLCFLPPVHSALMTGGGRPQSWEPAQGLLWQSGLAGSPSHGVQPSAMPFQHRLVFSSCILTVKITATGVLWRNACQSKKCLGR